MLANVIRKELEQIFCQFDSKLEAADEVRRGPRRTVRCSPRACPGPPCARGWGVGACRAGAFVLFTAQAAEPALAGACPHCQEGFQEWE